MARRIPRDAPFTEHAFTKHRHTASSARLISFFNCISETTLNRPM